jgi:hypothetical protein
MHSNNGINKIKSKPSKSSFKLKNSPHQIHQSKLQEIEKLNPRFSKIFK